MYAYIYTCISAYIYIYMYLCVCRYIYVCIYIFFFSLYIYICINICIHLYICIPVYTHDMAIRVHVFILYLINIHLGKINSSINLHFPASSIRTWLSSGGHQSSLANDMRRSGNGHISRPTGRESDSLSRARDLRWGTTLSRALIINLKKSRPSPITSKRAKCTVTEGRH